jgi:adenine-specific DNA-methyltransferase
MAKKQKKTTGPTPVDSIKHKDARVNIPTQELRGFVATDEAAPPKMLYPRDPSLDPQLVWRGKDAQDAADLAVPVVPVYIQEKIHPQALVENLRDTAKAGEDEPELTLFSDFNGIDDFDRKVDFYSHDAGSQPHWSNRMILGDSLLVMTSLAEKEGLKGKVQTIYFDPPYGIKFGSNWQVSTRKRDVKDGKAEDATRQPEQIRAFRDTWQLGIHSYLAYLRDRLSIARELLTESGSVFVQIGDENVHLVRCLMDEVFGSENFVAGIAMKKTTGASSDRIAGVFDTILWFGKSGAAAKYRQLYFEKVPGEEGAELYNWVADADGRFRRATADEIANPPSNLRFFASDQLSSQRPPQGTDVTRFRFGDREFTPGKGTFKTDEKGLTRLTWAHRLIPSGDALRYVRYVDDFPAFPLSNLWTDTSTGSFTESKVYVVQTGIKVIQRCLLMTTDPGDLVLDPTCGSGTTAYMAEQWGRRWITIDTSRVALALARTRLMAAKYPYYLLADSPEGVKKESEITGKIPPDYKTDKDIRRGFVYKRVPHVTLKSIANNPDIEEGMSREDIDAAIAKHAETETLYDKPYEDNKRVRVTGPFTVESLSPHRVVSTDQEAPKTEMLGRRESDSGQFEAMILDNLRKAGVQNTKKNERLVFDPLNPHPGQWIQASGLYKDTEGKSRRVAVSIGPEHGTVGPQQVKSAALEAVKGLGHDVLVVCGFAFDPHVSEEAKNYGKLTVLPTRMNPDLTMGEELLKKTGAANLFTVFGEPDIEVTGGKDGYLTVHLNGLDVYDPTTGAIRSSSTDDIACWFIDTDYDGQSFFVRHAYFTGADEPYDKLKRALRADIDESAWSTLYSTTSRPFAQPETGKIAVKVINHYGDEVLKVYDV